MDYTNLNALRRLLPESSRRCIDYAAEIISGDESYFLKMTELALLEEPVISARASRAVKYAAEKHPEYYSGNAMIFISKLPELSNESVKSAFLSMIMLNQLPDDENVVGFLMNYCFDEIDRVGVQAGPKVYCMDILYNISNIYPELKTELKAIIESRSDFATPAIASRGMTILKKLKKEIKP